MGEDGRRRRHRRVAESLLRPGAERRNRAWASRMRAAGRGTAGPGGRPDELALEGFLRFRGSIGARWPRSSPRTFGRYDVLPGRPSGGAEGPRVRVDRIGQTIAPTTSSTSRSWCVRKHLIWLRSGRRRDASLSPGGHSRGHRQSAPTISGTRSTPPPPRKASASSALSRRPSTGFAP